MKTIQKQGITERFREKLHNLCRSKGIFMFLATKIANCTFMPESHILLPFPLTGPDTGAEQQQRQFQCISKQTDLHWGTEPFTQPTSGAALGVHCTQGLPGW